MKSIIVLAALAVATLPLPVLASQARASGNAYVHDGPGSDYPVIDNLEDGEYYDVLDCTRKARWCLVGDGEEELGWVRGSSLIGSPAKVNVTPFEWQVTPEFFQR